MVSALADADVVCDVDSEAEDDPVMAVAASLAVVVIAAVPVEAVWLGKESPPLVARYPLGG